MYGELVRRLREATIRADSGNEISESLYIDILQAADAIEELCGLCASQSKDCSEAVAKYLELWAKQPRWIPVEERLPDVDEKVLTFARNKYDGSWFMDITSWTGVRNHDEYQFWGYGDSMKVTHWMPIPEPPKEETE